MAGIRLARRRYAIHARITRSGGELAAAGRLTHRWTAKRGLSPEEARRAIHGAMEEASRDSVCMMLAPSRSMLRGGERPQPYLLRLSENSFF